MDVVAVKEEEEWAGAAAAQPFQGQRSGRGEAGEGHRVVVDLEAAAHAGDRIEPGVPSEGRRGQPGGAQDLGQHELVGGEAGELPTILFEYGEPVGDPVP